PPGCQLGFANSTCLAAVTPRGILERMRFLLIACAAAALGTAQVLPIQEAWDDLLGPSPATAPIASTAPRSDFADHFFFEGRTDYWRYSTSFTGLPTTTSVIDAPFTGIFNPGGIPYPDAFQPVANRVDAFIDWGTRGYLSDRVNTHFR